MPRPIIGIPEANARPSGRSRVESQALAHIGPARVQLQQRLRQKRSKGYTDVISRMDVGAYQADPGALRALLEAVSAEFPELRIDQQPLGIVSRCYLGAPFEVHICDLTGEIIMHFETFRSMPALFERARSLAIHPGYAFVEVYSDTLRAVASDGAVSIVDG